MTNTTLTADSGSSLSPVSASFRWEVPEKGITVHLSLDVVDRMEKEVLEAFRAVTSRGSEVGGILLGRFSTSGRRTVLVESYEPIACDYSRGPLYLMADPDKQRLAQTIAKFKGPGTPSVVGFYRSNTRRETILDDEDAIVMQDYFSEPHNVILLVKPFSMKPSQAGFWFWEGGDVRTGESHFAFPFKRAELEKSFSRYIVQPGEAPAAVRSSPGFPVPRRPEPVPPAPEPEAQSEPAPPPMSIHEDRPGITPVFKRPEPVPPAAPPLSFKREDRPSVLPLPRRDAPPPPPAPRREEAGPQPISIKREDRPVAVPPPRREEKPAITLRKEEKPPAPPVERPAPPPVKEAREERPAPPVKPAPPKEDRAVRPPSRPEPPQVTLETPATIALSEPAPGFMARLGAVKWVIFALLLAGLGAGGYWKYRISGGRVAVPDTLALKVEPTEGKLVLSWNRNFSLIASAQRATLTIVDGGHKEDADLDLGRLRDGRIEYWPVTNDVSFRLEVADLKHAKTQSESVRVLGRPSPTAIQPVQQAAPEPQQPQQQQQAAAPPPAPKPEPKATQAASAPPPEPVQRTVTAPAPIAAAVEPPPRPQVSRVTTAAPRADSLAARLRPAESLPEPPRIDSEGTPQFAEPPATGTAPIAAPPTQPPPPVAQAPKPAAQPAAQPAPPPRIGGNVQEARPLRKVLPNYPPLARQARVTGVVRVEAVIGADGRVKRAKAVSGPPLLQQAAVDSVLRWSYEPGKLNGKPVETTTQVDVIFAPPR